MSLRVARRRAAKRKMKQMKSHSSKDADEFDEETEDMFSEFGQFLFHSFSAAFILSSVVRWLISVHNVTFTVNVTASEVTTEGGIEMRLLLLLLLLLLFHVTPCSLNFAFGASEVGFVSEDASGV